MKTIEIKCSGSGERTIGSLKKFQGKLKTLSPKNLTALKERIKKDGFISPFFVWANNGKNFILDGHQRIEALYSLEKDGYMIPALPVVYVEAADEAEARRRVLSISSQYGEFDRAELESWLFNIDSDIAESFRLVDTEIKRIDKQIEDDFDYDVKYKPKLELIIEMEDEECLKSLYEEIIKRGYVCRISTL